MDLQRITHACEDLEREFRRLGYVSRAAIMKRALEDGISNEEWLFRMLHALYWTLDFPNWPDPELKSRVNFLISDIKGTLALQGDRARREL